MCVCVCVCVCGVGGGGGGGGYCNVCVCVCSVVYITQDYSRVLIITIRKENKTFTNESSDFNSLIFFQNRFSRKIFVQYNHKTKQISNI